jgi:3-oxoacyl-[acyl-carrier protein] reductase
MSNQSRTAIVTGASRGIGAAIAQRLAADGLRIVVNYSSSPAEADAVVAAIVEAGGEARAIRANVADAAEMTALFDQAEAAFGPVDVLVNNAGILTVAPLAQVSDEEFERIFSINLKGSFNGMREAARRLRDGGRIINFSTSIVGHYLPGYGPYAATKAAVEALTAVLAKELGGRGITVNAVAPGPVGTEMLINSRPAEMLQRLAAESPLNRLGEPDDIARVVAFLASPESEWVNGQTIRANGGRN